MIHKGVARTFFLYAYSIASGIPKTGDAANIIVYKAEDMGPATQVTDTITEIDPTNMPGWYRLTTTLNGNSVAISSRSSTSGVAVTLAGAYLNTGAIPAVDAGANRGIPIIGSAPLTNLDAAISSRMAASSYIAPDNANIAAIKSQTDKLSFVGSDVKATLDNEQVTVAVNNDKTGYSLTADYNRAKTALAITEYIAPDNASIAAIKSQTNKLQFDSNNYVYAVGIGGGGGVQVVVQPLVANVQRTDGDGGTITGWTYAKLVASWTISDADLRGHDLAIILYDPSDSETRLAQYHSDEITITYQSPDSLVTLSGSDSKTPSAGVYSYVIRDLTTDVILLSGRCVIRSAPDVQ